MREGEKSESLSSTAELSDLVCYQHKISEARAEITGALYTHTYTHRVMSYFTTQELH